MSLLMHRVQGLQGTSVHCYGFEAEGDVAWQHTVQSTGSKQQFACTGLCLPSFVQLQPWLALLGAPCSSPCAS